MATRADVANLAGVSASTVSYVLSGQRPISDETKAKVLKAVAALNYRPNFAAGALAGGKSKSLALVAPSGEYGVALIALEYINGAGAAARARGYHLVIWPSEENKMDEIKTFAQSGMISGVILMEIKLEDDRVTYLAKEKIPFSMIGRTANSKSYSFVDRDFEGVASLGVKYLSSLGHNNVAYLSTDRDIGVDTKFSAAVAKVGKSLKMKVKKLRVVNSVLSGREAFILLLNKYPEVTGVISLNDIATYGFLAGAKEFGVRIPKDLSVIGLDTPQNHIEISWPHLTTVNLPAHEMGAAAVNMLVDEIENIASKDRQQLLVGDLIIRGTTARVRKD